MSSIAPLRHRKMGDAMMLLHISLWTFMPPTAPILRSHHPLISPHPTKTQAIDRMLIEVNKASRHPTMLPAEEDESLNQTYTQMIFLYDNIQAKGAPTCCGIHYLMTLPSSTDHPRMTPGGGGSKEFLVVGRYHGPCTP